MSYSSSKRKQVVRRAARLAGMICRAAAAPILVCLWAAVPARAQAVGGLVPIDSRAEAIYHVLDGAPEKAWSEVRIWRRCTFEPLSPSTGPGPRGHARPVADTTNVHPDELLIAVDGCLPFPVSQLTLKADRNRVTTGDTIGFTFQAENNGRSLNPEPVLVDTLPASVRLLPGTVRLDGAVLDEGAFTLTPLPDGREVLTVPVGALPPQGRRTVDFRTVVVGDTSVSTITNAGWLRDGLADAESNVVEIGVALPEIALEITIPGRSVIYVGDSIVFQLKYRNVSAVRAENAVLTNFLPPEMELLGATPDPSAMSRESGPGVDDVGSAEADGVLPRLSRAPQGESSGPDWVSWQLGTLESGEEGFAYIHARLVRLPDGGGNELHNEATLSIGSAGYTVVVAAALAPVAQDPSDGRLALSKKAGLLEVGLGEAVPYLLEVENTGPIELYDLVVRDRLPEGLVLVDRTVQGADSVTTEGGEVLFHLPGPLHPGEKHLVRYSAIAVSAPGEAVVNRAVAEAAFGRVVSDPALAQVRIRRGPALPSKTLIGKVWIDRNGNGRQDAGEEGVAGVDIWTTDGQIVRTDAEGRYSLQNLEPGRYTLRLDMLGLDDRYEVADRGGEIREVLLDGWTVGRADFRLVPREMLVDWHAGPPPEVLGFDLKASENGPASTAVRVAAARDSAERATERRQDLIMGPGVEIVSPGDGSVIATGKVYIGVRGEPGRPVELLGRDGVVREGTIRPDGVVDFIAVDLEPGPNRFRVRTVNSWGQERWDSIAVHRSGAPARFEVARSPRVVRAESPEVDTLHVRVLDEWGVPVVTEPVVTIDAHGVTVEAVDGDRSSAGVQLRADRAGWLRVPVRGGERPGEARVVFGVGRATGEQAFEVLTPVRPLFATMAGRIGLGGAEEGSFASITARGALDEMTSLTLSYDTRRGDRENTAFGRDYDPLDETLLPVTGDRSQRRVVSGSTNTFSARVERGQDWISFGDVRTEGFAGRGKLTTYDRALTGVSTRLGWGNVAWHGFGSATRQLYEEVQLRGDGTSGPYPLGGRVRPGTDRIAIELRASDNTARVLTRTELHRYADYQIDYRTGEVLLNRLLPAADAQGNAYFLVASIERLDADERHWTGGMRVEVDAGSALGLDAGDSLSVSVFGIHDGGAITPGIGTQAGSGLFGGEVAARLGTARVGLELLQSRADSTGLASRAAVEWSPWQERAHLRGEWMGVGSGFSSQQQSRLRSGVEELRLGGEFRLMESLRLELGHDRQSFRDHGVERHNSQLRLTQLFGERAISLEGGLIEEEREGAAAMSAVQTRLNARLSEDVTVWAEGRQALGEATTGVGRSQIGVGASLRVLDRVRVEGQHRLIDAEQPYSVSSVTLNVEPWEGGQLRGGLENATGDNADRGLNLGWSQHLRLPAGWSLSSQLERRVGLDDLSLADPLRAMPFPQIERDRFSAGLGVQWDDRAGERSLTARGEYYDGDLRSGYRFEAQGDVSIGKDVALLARHDWLLNEHSNSLGTNTDRRDHSLLGVAFRPTGSNALNALVKLEWRRTVRPDGGPSADPTLSGENARLIGSTDLVWLPSSLGSVTLRYALRGSSVTNEVFGDQTVHSQSHFFGSSLEHRVRGRAWGRLDSRLLHVTTTGDTRWSLAPTLVFDLAELEVEGGYRFGNLKDIDFSGRGGLGFFASIGVRLTESSVRSAAGMWRERLGR